MLQQEATSAPVVGGDAPSARLAALVEDFDAADVDAMDDAGLAHELVAMRRGIDRLEAQFSRRLIRFDAIRGPERAGSVNLLAWLRWACRMGTGAAARRLNMARQLTDLPDTERAWRSGAIGTGHAAVIGRSVDDVGTDRARAAEPELLEAAERMTPGHVWLVGQQIRHRVDPAGALASANAQHARRRLSLSTNLDGAMELAGILDAEGGAVLRTALDALTRPLPGDERIAAQRRADALVELARRQLDCGDRPGAGGVRPHLSVTVPLSTLRGDGGGAPADLEWAGPIVDAAALRLGCDAARSAVVVDEDGRPVGAGRASRTIPSSVRRALVARDGGCRFPGCDRPPSWTDGHHVLHWAHGGDHELDNLLLLCRPHHRLVHEEGWTIEISGDGEVVAAPP